MKYTPLKMQPCYKRYLWGGTKLKRQYGKISTSNVIAESWELSCRPDGNSEVAEGPLKGKTLADLACLDQIGYWGNACLGDEFPILVKLIDAEKNLSIQVHPSNQTAHSCLGEQGKAEMWYVVACEAQAFLYFGFSKHISREEFMQRVMDGTICEVINRVPVSKGDVFYILPGVIHAIGAGILIAEIQQNSNTTFRVYDYQRIDIDGKPRPLHLERAAAVLDYEPIIPMECRANSNVSFPGFSMTEMFSCEYFRAYRLDVNGLADLRCDGISFQHLVCVEGSGEIFCQGEKYSFQKGDSYFLPAALGEYAILGICRLLVSRV